MFITASETRAAYIIRYTLIVAAAMVALLLSESILAADAGTQKRAELKQIHGKVETLKKDLSKSEKTRTTKLLISCA